MRKAQKQKILGIIESLHQVHEEIKKALEQNNVILVQDMISVAQESAIALGENIEKAEGEGHITVLGIEEYCELLFRVFEDINNNNVNANKVHKTLRRKLIKIENSVKNDIVVRTEIVFFPYKASMWDSLESVYFAAKEDPQCDAYCVPIPYFDLNPDHSLGKVHYEGNAYPEGIEIIDWEKYDFEVRKPDVIYIHNPYDGCNLVTSVHPRFYSSNLKKYTDTLVYIPYYVSSGSMLEAQSMLPAYLYADYIVIQAPQFRKYFDLNLSDNKFLPLGSPKFDKIINKCQNPPEPSKEWKRKMAGRKVYFYNTSISGMLADTEAFLKKMHYVFQCFEGREDACLLWRPHPLLETTFESMRPQYWVSFKALKQLFLEKDIGILDTTPDIADTIALSDAYIGDTGTSIISLFGMAGKPLFILNNYIHALPAKDDWRGEKITLMFDIWDNNRYQIIANNQLWFSPNNDYHYKFYMDLGCEFCGVKYYMKAVEIGDKIYVLPCNAQNLLIIKNKEIKKVEFEKQISGRWAFFDCCYDEQYIFMFPQQYPRLIRFDVVTEEIQYIDGIKQFYIREKNEKLLMGGRCFTYGNEIVLASPVDDEFLFIDKVTLDVRCVSSHSPYNLGVSGIVPDPYGDELWLMPMNGATIICWNPKTGEIKEYDNLPEGFQSNGYASPTEKYERPFGTMLFSREGENENIVISPLSANMYLTLDRETGRMEKWILPIDTTKGGKSGYFPEGERIQMNVLFVQRGKGECKLWCGSNSKMYDLNIDTGKYKEIEIEFDYHDLQEHESGFAEHSERSGYFLKENAFNSLKDFLDDKITGKRFDKECQIEVFTKINASPDGNCGRKIYDLLKEKNREKT